jgi:hypothetical protein
VEPSDVEPARVLRKTHCAERARLLIEYSEAVTRIEPLARVLSDGTLPYRRETFLDAWERLKDASEDSVRIRMVLLNHVNEHGCAVQMTPAKHCAA